MCRSTYWNVLGGSWHTDALDASHAHSHMATSDDNAKIMVDVKPLRSPSSCVLSCVCVRACVRVCARAMFVRLCEGMDIMFPCAFVRSCMYARIHA